MNALFFKVLILNAAGLQDAVLAEESYIIYGSTLDAVRYSFERHLRERASAFPNRYARFQPMEPVAVQSYVLTRNGREPVNWPDLQNRANLTEQTHAAGGDETAAVLLFFSEPDAAHTSGKSNRPEELSSTFGPSKEATPSAETKVPSEHLYIVTTIDNASKKLMGEAQLVGAATFDEACSLIERHGVSAGNRMDVELCPPILSATDTDDRSK